MRLSTKEREAIVRLGEKHFHRPIWLFGSRVNDHQRGGDIDLFVDSDSPVTISSELDFLFDLKGEIGDQRIDVSSSPNLRNDVYQYGLKLS